MKTVFPSGEHAGLKSLAIGERPRAAAVGLAAPDVERKGA